MTPLFSKRSNLYFRGVLILGPLLLIGGGGLVYAIWWSPYLTRQEQVIEQPVPFSHQHHVTVLGIDCRYCHQSVEVSSSAGIPATETCMTCHSQVWTEAPVLEPVRKSLRTGEPIRWKRVHDLPEFTYFNHSIHVAKGVRCVQCHGPVGEMPMTWQSEPLYMKWCLECHRHPEGFTGPTDEVFSLEPKTGSVFAESTGERSGDVPDDYPFNLPLTDCSKCHR